MWEDFQDSIPPRLLSIAEDVKQTVFASKAGGTIRTYLGGYNRWKRWAKSNGLNYLPANPFHVAMYLQVILQSASSPSPINNAVYRIDWVHGLAGFQKVSSHCLVQSMMGASKRVLAKPKNRKEPITPEMLQQLTKSLKDKSCVPSCRTLALCLIGFAGFLRFSELCSVRACDVSLYSSYCALFLES